MEKKKLLLIAYRAYGDWVYTSAVLPYLLEKYDVYLDCNTKGWQLFHDDTRFKQVALCRDVETVLDAEERSKVFQARWERLREQVKPDVEINLNGTLELECIAENFQKEFWEPVGERRAKFGANGFYDAVLKKCGIPASELKTLNGFYWHPDQIEHVEKWREKHKDKFVVILPIAGSTAQKIIHNFKQIAQAILDKYDDALIYLAGDEPCRAHIFEHPRVKTMIGDEVTPKQAIHMAGYADMVIGPETFLLAAAGMWGTPKIIHATTSSVYQMTQYQKNDFSIQAPIHCSPCHRAIYYDFACETPIRTDKGEWVATACSQMFRLEDIMQRVDFVYRTLRKGGRNGSGSSV